MIIKRRTYEKRIDDAIEAGKFEGSYKGREEGYQEGLKEGRSEGRSEGIKAAIVNLLSSNCIIFNDKTGYGSSKKIAVNLDDPKSILEVVALVDGGLS